VDAGVRRGSARSERRHHRPAAASPRTLRRAKQAETARKRVKPAFHLLADAAAADGLMCTPDGLNVYFTNGGWITPGMSLLESYGKGWNTPSTPTTISRLDA